MLTSPSESEVEQSHPSLRRFRPHIVHGPGQENRLKAAEALREGLSLTSFLHLIKCHSG